MTHPDTPENWGNASRGYAEKIAPRLMRAYADAFVERLDVRSDADVLEVAAGSGAVTEVLFRKAKSVLATDFAPQMIDVLRSRLDELGATNVDYAVMDGQSLDLEDGRFDRAICSFALMLFPDQSRGFSELRRILRPGGRVVVSAWAGPDQFEVFGLFLSAVRQAFPDLPPAPMPVFSLADPDEFRGKMVAANFSEVEVSHESRELTVPNFEELWEMLTVGAPPVQLLLDRVGTEGQQRLRSVLSELIEERFGGGAIVTTNVATMGTGVA